MPETKSTATGQKLRPGNENERYSVWILLVITGITYLATLRFGFVYDDGPQIVSNPLIKAWRYLPQDFTSGLWKQLISMKPSNYYRPLFVLLMRINYTIFHDRSLGWHLTALLLHLVVTWLTYTLVRKVTGQFTVAWLSTLIFGVHPIHHEVVAWISGTTESLCAVFFVGAFLAYLQSLEKSRCVWMTVSGVLYALALLSKETAILLPALVFSYECLGPKPGDGSTRPKLPERIRRALVATSPYIPIALAYLIARDRILTGLGNAYASISVSVWLRTLPSILSTYVAHWIYPANLAEFYDVFYLPKFDLLHVLLPALVLFAIGAAVWVFRKRLDENMATFAAAWIVISLLPGLDTFVFSPQELVHDRYFYIPSIGAAMLTALVIVRGANTRVGLFGLPWHVAVAGLAVSIVLAPLAMRAASFWADDYTLFTRAHQVAPLNSKADINLGSDLLALGRIDEAQNLLETAFQQHTDDPVIAAYLGRVHYARKQYAEAEYYARRAVALDPSMPDGYFFLGLALLKENHPADAESSMRRAVELNPYSAQFHISYGLSLQVNGNCGGAKEQFDAALALDPGDFITKRLQTIHCRPQVSSSAPPAPKPGNL
jgi:tetratricopeptide (TPR) repeat protein